MSMHVLLPADALQTHSQNTANPQRTQCRSTPKTQRPHSQPTTNLPTHSQPTANLPTHSPPQTNPLPTRCQETASPQATCSQTTTNPQPTQCKRTAKPQANHSQPNRSLPVVLFKKVLRSTCWRRLLAVGRSLSLAFALSMMWRLVGPNVTNK